MKKKILVIEDDLNILKNIKNILEEENYEVATAEDGLVGVKLASEFLPDLIVCDIALPKKNGYEILENISSNKNTNKIPFIFLTAKVEKEDLRKGMRLGADDYIFKPFDISDLLESINMRINKKNNLISDFSNENQNNKKDKYAMEDKLIFNYTGKPLLRKISKIKYLKAETPYVKIKFSSHENVLQRETLNFWEEKLPSNYFVRIHRSSIINTNYINRIERINKVTYLIHIQDETETFILSKRARAKFKEKYS